MGAEVGWVARGLDEVPDDHTWLSPRERERAAAMRFTKRRSEFLVSRLAAKEAIARGLGRQVAGPADLAAIEVTRRPTGAPAALLDGAPAGLAMSSTDRADWAVTVVSDAPALELGCDLELVEPRSSGFVQDYLTAVEQELVRSGRWPVEVAANLLWSAKESALKVLQTGLRRDTRSVEVALVEGEMVDGWLPLEVRPVEGGLFPGWWRRSGSFLLTVAGSGPLEAPVALAGGDPLVPARPTHRWLEAMLTEGRSPGST